LTATLSEGDLVSGYAAFLRNEGWRVVVTRPSQASIFFTMEGGRRKGPDVVAVKRTVVLSLEAKVRAAGLFRRAPPWHLSDCDVMNALAASEAYQAELLSRVAQRLGDMDVRLPVIAGLLAATTFPPEGLEEASQLLCVQRLSSGEFRIVSSAVHPD